MHMCVQKAKIGLNSYLCNMYTDEDYMRMALEQAREAALEGEIPIGAVVVCKGRVIARAHNLTERLNDPTAHAEMQAITMSTEYLGGKYLEECTMYVTVEPCPMCAAALNWSQISCVVWGADDPKRGSTLFSPSLFHPRTQIRRGVLAQECSDVMKSFFKSIRK